MTTDLTMLRVIDQNTGEQVVIDLSATGEVMVEDVAVGPPSSIFDITPSDDDNLEHVTRGIYVGTSGDIKLTTTASGTCTFVGVAGGLIFPICAIKVFETGTDAEDLIGVY